MNNDYFVQSSNKGVRVSRIIKGELEVIRFNGDSAAIPFSDFWAIFKQKIEYESGESLAFIILSDDENFEMDAEIIISEKFISENSELKSLMFEHKRQNNYLITYPTLDINLDEVKFSPQINLGVDEPELEQEQEIVGGSLQNYFRKQTRSMERKNNKVTGDK